MADRYPLVVASGVVQELASSENLNLKDSGIVGLSSLTVVGSSSSTLVRFTQEGSGEVLRVEDSTNPDTTSFVVTTDGSVGIGTDDVATTQFSEVKIHISDGGTVEPLLLTSDYCLVSTGTATSTGVGFAVAVASTTPGQRGVFKAIKCSGSLENPQTFGPGEATGAFIASIWDGDTARFGATAGVDMLCDGVVSIGTAPQRVEIGTGETRGRIPRIVVKSNGMIGIGSTVPESVFDVNAFNLVGAASSLNFFLPSRLNATEISGLTTVAGAIIYNTTTNKHQGYDGTTWNDLY